MYALQVYGITARTNLNKIRVAQSKVVRSLCYSPWYMRTRDIEREVNIPKIGDILRIGKIYATTRFPPQNPGEKAYPSTEKNKAENIPPT